MARSLLRKIYERVIGLIIFALVFGFVPYMLYQSACGTTNQAKMNEEFGKVKRFGAPQKPTAPTSGGSRPSDASDPAEGP